MEIFWKFQICFLNLLILPSSESHAAAPRKPTDEASTKLMWQMGEDVAEYGRLLWLNSERAVFITPLNYSLR